jgi:acetylornithine/N-succinyldiaminopimelate aminotransferase
MTDAVVPEWRDRYARDIVGVFATPPLLLDHGRGAYVWDSDGNEYLDFLGGIAVNSLGHAHPALVDAVSAQIARLAHVSNLFASAPQLELAERLQRLTGAGADGRVFFTNSGTEANEAAFKLARRNGTAHEGDGGRHRILALNNGFHGRTMGALALTGKPAMRAPFEPMTPGVEHIDADLNALEAAIDDTVAALVVEPIQGEAGVLELPDGFLAAARRLTAEHGALLIVDEIQTGIGRTGTWFGYQQADILPDAITLAKGMAGGVPIGALVTFGWASALFEPGQHGTTFGGNPLATAAANAVLGEIERADLVTNARVRGEQLRETLRGLSSPLLGDLNGGDLDSADLDGGDPRGVDLRGAGLLIGIGLTRPVANELVAAALRHGLIVNAPNASTIRLAPPLIIGDDEVAEFRRRFGAALRELGAPDDLSASTQGAPQ